MTRQFMPLNTTKEPFPEDFRRVPAALLMCEQLRDLSFEALIVYGFLYDLAYCEGTSDDEGNGLVRFTQVEMANMLRCKREHARTIWHELDGSGLGLIEQVRVDKQYMLRINNFKKFMTTI